MSVDEMQNQAIKGKDEESSSAARGGLGAVLRAEYLQPAFLICAVVLLTTASGLSMAVKSFGMYLKKEPLPLKKSMDLLERDNLGAYKVVKKELIENEDVIETLGTEDYIQWQLEDTSVAADSAVRYCMLFITYYGLPDVVPHVPDECYTGGGYRKLSSEDVILQVLRDDRKKLPAKYVVFASTDASLWTGSMKFPVLYMFGVNGDYAAGRQDVRMILNRSFFRKYSYFSKIELKFFNGRLGRITYPNKEEAIAASEKLLGVILPILEKDYWPADLWKSGR